MKHINPIKHTTAENYEHFLSYMYGAGARHNALLCQAYFDGADAPHEEYEAYMAAHPEPVKQEPAHPDDEAVDLFAAAMKAKLAKKRAEGRGGWDDKERCSAEFLNHLLNEHVGKGDPVDVGNLAMMLWNRGERTTAEPVKREPIDESWCIEPKPVNGLLVSEPVKQEPEYWEVHNGVCPHGVYRTEEQAEQVRFDMQKAHDLSGSLASFNVRPLYAAPVDAKAIGDALLFLIERCNEQGFYSPTKQPIVQTALEAIRRLK